MVCSALAKGSGFNIVPPAPLLEGGMVAYGFLRGLLPTLRQARIEGRPWVYADRGYFRASYGDDYSGFFRVTRGAMQHSGHGDSGYAGAARWSRLLVRMAPWRHGRHVLVCPPGEVFTQAVGGFSSAEWLESTIKELKAHTERPINVRYKMPQGKGRPLADDLQNCHALVTYMSNTAVEAVVAGVPVFCTGQCAASAMGRSDLSQIETPAYPDWREKWAANLAANQWTLRELEQGLANGVFA